MRETVVLVCWELAWTIWKSDIVQCTIKLNKNVFCTRPCASESVINLKKKGCYGNHNKIYHFAAGSII